VLTPSGGALIPGRVGAIVEGMSISPLEAEALELEALGRKYAGIVHQARVEGLGRRLRASRRQLPVTLCRSMSGGRKLVLSLADGTMLRLQLFWSEHCPIAAVCGVGWDDRIGWVFDLRRQDGDVTRVFAWRARLDHLARQG
jgi:hypothetical protein